MQKQEMELKLKSTEKSEQVVAEEEERTKVTEEKFQKLKTMYSQIREEHIKLLRQASI